jgi:hypothetical protein
VLYGERVFRTDLYALNPSTGIRYNYNSGQPNLDNPKLAARNFLNAIDRVDHLLDRHREDQKKFEQEIPVLEQVLRNSFDKDDELKALKAELSNLERKITTSLHKGEGPLMQETAPTAPSTSVEIDTMVAHSVKDGETGVKVFPMSDRVKELLHRTAIQQTSSPLSEKKGYRFKM